MRTPTLKRKPRKVSLASFSAPTGGLVSNRNLAMGYGPDMPPGAAVLDNFFPTASGAVLRRGSTTRNTLAGGEIKAMFSYIAGSRQEMFAANDSAIWDITTTEAQVYSEVTEGNWTAVQYATSGGAFLVGANGTDEAFVYDGTSFYPLVDGGVYSLDFDAEVTAFTVGETLTGGTSGATAEIIRVTSDGLSGQLLLKNVSGGPFTDDEAITSSGGSATADGVNAIAASGISFPVGSTLTTADLSYVWVYKSRIWFLEKDSLNAWYLPVDSIGGELTLWPMGGVFVRGGTLLWGQGWSLSGGEAGGLSEQCVFATTEGEVAAYQGLSPEVDQGWSHVGTYRIGKPLGAKALIRAGGDIVVATSVGFVSLAAASQQDYAALGQNAISYPIEDDWAEAVQDRGQDDWRCQVWADGQMALISTPTIPGSEPKIFVSNTMTGRWGVFSGWDARSFEIFSGGLFFGTTEGLIKQAWVSGSDDGNPYVGRVVPLFSDQGAPASLKVAKMARAVTRSRSPVKPRLSGQSNYSVDLPAAPNAPEVEGDNVWDVGVWDGATWGGDRGAIVSGDWVSVGASGYDLSVGFQVTSGATTPVDVEIVRIDLTYTVGDIGS